MEAFGNSHGLHSKIVFHLTLVLDELITNIISYGYADFDEHPHRRDHRPSGRRPDHPRSRTIPSPSTSWRPRSPSWTCPWTNAPSPWADLGIHLVKNMVHGIHYKRENDKNVLTLHKNISKTHCPGAGLETIRRERWH